MLVVAQRFGQLLAHFLCRSARSAAEAMLSIVSPRRSASRLNPSWVRSDTRSIFVVAMRRVYVTVYGFVNGLGRIVDGNC